jgi:hypothetical protein
VASRRAPLTGWNDLDPNETSWQTRLAADQAEERADIDSVTRELTDKIGLGGSLGSVSAGGLTIGAGLGLGVYGGGILKTNIQPNGTLVIGSDVARSETTTEIFFTEDTDYNGEQFEAGDFLIGDNSDGVGNVKWDALEGQLQFRSGTTVKAYMDTDGSIKFGEGVGTLDEGGISILTPNGAAADPNSYKFVDANGNTLFRLAGYYSGTTMNALLETLHNGSMADSNLSIGTPNAAILISTVSDSIKINSGLNDIDTIIYWNTEEAIIVDGETGKVFINAVQDPLSAYQVEIGGSVNISSGETYDINGTPHTHAGEVTNGDSHDHAGGDGAQIDHGGLAGLADDDHTAYLLATGLREWSEQGSDPATPAAGKWKLYFKAGGIYHIDDAGVVTGPLSTGGSGGHTIKDEGTPVTDRAGLNFVGGGVAVSDDAGNNETDVTIPDVAAQIAAASNKAPLVSNDKFGVADSEASNVLKYANWGDMYTQLVDTFFAYNYLLPTATAANDFAVGNGGTGEWIKKTLAETRAILGNKYSNLIGGNGVFQTVAASTTSALALFASGLVPVGSNAPLSKGGTLKNLYVRIAGTQPASGNMVFTVMINNAASSITVTQAAGAGAATISDTTHTETVSAGDLVYLRVVNNATGASANLGVFMMELETTTTT